MGIFNKIWEKIQEQTKIDSILYDAERKLIDIPTLLNTTIKNICELTEEKKNIYKKEIENIKKQYEISINSLKQSLETNLDNNTKKQIEFEIKNAENQITKYNNINEILESSELRLNYLKNYQDRINYSKFFEQEKIIDIFSFFNLPEQFSPEQLINAREMLENHAYTLNTNEKNKKIDQINQYYEILTDPIRLNAYKNLIEDPSIIEILNNHINELSKINSKITENESILTKKVLENNEQNEEIETLQIEELYNDFKENNIKDSQEINQVPINFNKINKELLQEQKEKIEEQLIPKLANLNKQIKEENNELLIIAKNSLLKQYKNTLTQNDEYQKILEELEKLN